MTGRFNFSKPGRRGPNDPWFRIGTFDVNTSAFVAGLAALSMFVYAANKAWFEPLYLFPADVRRGEIWRLITWPIPNAPDIWTVVMIAMFWYFGRTLEESIGRVRFLWFLLILTIIPGLVATAVDLPAGGLRPVQLAVFVCFAIEHPSLRFFFGIPAWVIAAVIVGVDVLQLLGEKDSEGLLFLVVMLAVAVFALRAFGLGEAVPWVPRVKLPTRGDSKGGRTRKKRKGTANLSVVPRPSAAQPRAPVMSAEIDSLLDKISEHGIESLTPAERARLEEHSKRLRGDG